MEKRKDMVKEKENMKRKGFMRVVHNLAFKNAVAYQSTLIF